MEIIVISHEKCIKCKKCIDECPADVLEMNDSLQIAKPELCVSCGHCAAICPQSAIACSDKNKHHPFNITKIHDDLPIDRKLFHTKRSTRKFLNKSVDNNDLSEIVRYAEKAPSSHNLRNREYLIITDAEDIKQISDKIVKTYKSLLRVLNPFTLWLISLSNKNAHKELLEMVAAFKYLIEMNKQGQDKIFRNSKCIICIAAPRGSIHSKDDCIASQHYMMLFAHSIGISSFIVGFAQYAHKIIEKHFKLKGGISIFSVSALGYAKHSYSNEIIYQSPQILWR
jgi:nitroreductase/NAD-dependent dihydropyrimidine dehydrogenase PreA subunit